jgi:hypothetical protein
MYPIAVWDNMRIGVPFAALKMKLVSGEDIAQKPRMVALFCFKTVIDGIFGLFSG